MQCLSLLPPKLLLQLTQSLLVVLVLQPVLLGLTSLLFKFLPFISIPNSMSFFLSLLFFVSMQAVVVFVIIFLLILRLLLFFLSARLPRYCQPLPESSRPTFFDPSGGTCGYRFFHGFAPRVGTFVQLGADQKTTELTMSESPFLTHFVTNVLSPATSTVSASSGFGGAQFPPGMALDLRIAETQHSHATYVIGLENPAAKASTTIVATVQLTFFIHFSGANYGCAGISGSYLDAVGDGQVSNIPIP